MDRASRSSDITVDLSAGTASGQGFGHDTLKLSALDQGRFVRTGNGDDTIVGGPGEEDISTGGGLDQVSGGGADDVVEASGRSTVSGGTGDDWIVMLNDRDGGIAHGDKGDDTIYL